VTTILLEHGSGGRLTQRLVAEHFLPRLDNPVLSAMEDSAVMGDVALTIDSYVVTPRFFPGGDLGALAVCGTVNDLWASGAEPAGLAAAFTLEEGFPLEELDRLTESMAEAAVSAGVDVVAGDTKVVPRGACDGVFVTSAGVGRLRPGFRPRPGAAKPGDSVIISGTIADHGIAVLVVREGLRLQGPLASDVAPIGNLVRTLRDENLDVHALRDPTRGGIAQSLIEIAMASAVRIVVEEDAVPVSPPVRAACEILGLDPLYVANEGKIVVVLPSDQAAIAVELLRRDPLGVQAAVIGRVEEGPPGCELATSIGGRRSLSMLTGQLLPRIC